MSDLGEDGAALAAVVLTNTDKLLEDLQDSDSECQLDHTGACQAHLWFGDGECPQVRIPRQRKALKGLIEAFLEVIREDETEF